MPICVDCIIAIEWKHADCHSAAAPNYKDAQKTNQHSFFFLVQNTRAKLEKFEITIYA